MIHMNDSIHANDNDDIIMTAPFEGLTAKTGEPPLKHTALPNGTVHLGGKAYGEPKYTNHHTAHGTSPDHNASGQQQSEHKSCL